MGFPVVLVDVINDIYENQNCNLNFGKRQILRGTLNCLIEIEKKNVC